MVFVLFCTFVVAAFIFLREKNHHVAQAGRELMLLLPHLPSSWVVAMRYHSQEKGQLGRNVSTTY